MKIMKAHYAATLCIVIIPHLNAVHLTHPILKRIDGKIGLVGARIKDMLQIRRDLNNRLDGHKARNSQAHMGHYSMSGNSYTLRELATREKELHEKREAAKLSNNEMLVKEIDQELEQMKNLLESVKDDLFEIAEPFLGPASDMKPFAIPLIEESCEKRGNPKSLLLYWKDIPRGQEVALFKEKIQSFQVLLIFCTDLADYLIDMVESSPKAFAQFKRDYLHQ